MAPLRAQRIQGARIRENRDRVRLGGFRDMEPPTAGGVEWTLPEERRREQNASRRVRQNVPP